MTDMEHIYEQSRSSIAKKCDWVTPMFIVHDSVDRMMHKVLSNIESQCSEV